MTAFGKIWVLIITHQKMAASSAPDSRQSGVDSTLCYLLYNIQIQCIPQYSTAVYGNMTNEFGRYNDSTTNLYTQLEY